MTKPRGETPLLEWAVGLAGAAIFAVVLGSLVWSGVRGAAPPSISVTIERVTAVEAGFVAGFEAVNNGDETAADVEIVATLVSGEERRARFDYLAPHSARRGGFFFECDPGMAGVSIHAEGYNDP